MRAKTMEGLMGAGINRELSRTPMRVFKEARRKGDTEGMERAMGYVNDCGKRAEEYQTKAGEGMKEDAKDVKEAEKAAREKAIGNRREDREKAEKRIEAAREDKAAVVEISEEGRALSEYAGSSADGSVRVKTAEPETAKPDGVKPVAAGKSAVYTETGEIAQTGQGDTISVSV